MDRIVRLHVEKLPKGYWLATSEDVQGLVAQGRTIVEVLDIARDVARQLLEAQAERSDAPKLSEPAGSFDDPLVVGV